MGVDPSHALAASCALPRRPRRDLDQRRDRRTSWPRTDQVKLWRAADRLRVADDVLRQVAEAVGSAPEDAEIIDRIERHHGESKPRSSARSASATRPAHRRLRRGRRGPGRVRSRVAAMAPAVARRRRSRAAAISAGTGCGSRRARAEEAGARRRRRTVVPRASTCSGSTGFCQRRAIASAHARPPKSTRRPSIEWQRIAGDIASRLGARAPRADRRDGGTYARTVTALERLSSTEPDMNDDRDRRPGSRLARHPHHRGSARSVKHGESSAARARRSVPRRRAAMKPSLLELLGHGSRSRRSSTSPRTRTSPPGPARGADRRAADHRAGSGRTRSSKPDARSVAA